MKRPCRSGRRGAAPEGEWYARARRRNGGGDSLTVEFRKYHGLGNDYVVVAAGALGEPPDPEAVRRICDRHRGLGADGVLLDASPSRAGAGGGLEADAEADTGAAGRKPQAAVRIFNPDGSEAEKSGNGLRIFARYLRDRDQEEGQDQGWGRDGNRGQRQGDDQGDDRGQDRATGTGWFQVATRGGEVECSVAADGRRVAVEMGWASFDAAVIPVLGAGGGEVVGRRLEAGGEEVEYSAVTVGNPHCVVVRAEARAEEARSLGPLLERHPAFPNRTNVQFAEVRGPHRIRIEIWERGAGYTLASGTSSCAAAAVCCRRGLVRSPVTVEMPGGELSVVVREDWSLRMEGPVVAVARGVLSPECLDAPG